MKLANIANTGIIPDNTGIDIDVATRIGPAISQHLSALETLCKLLPNCDEIQQALTGLKSVISTATSLSDNVLENNLTHVDKSVETLKSRLTDIANHNGDLSYNAIDAVMQQICREDGCTPSDLHIAFRQANQGQTPDAWAASVSNKSLDEKMSMAGVIEMYETLKPGLGDKSWVSITKRLKAQGYNTSLVERMINRAITITSNNK